MRRIIDYTDDTKETIIAEQEAQGFRLIEDQRYIDGNHLIFSDEPLPRALAAEIDEIKAKMADYDDLKARIEDLEKK